MTKSITVLISGRGSNLKALFAASQQDDAPFQINSVISNRSEAAGLEWAASQSIDTKVLDHKSFDSKADFETALHEELIASQTDYVCLAGFMRLLSSAFVSRWRGKILNIHPSLLPSFEGLAPHQRALDAGVRISGCTVHFVSEEMDGGPIIAQMAVPVLKSDTEETLSARILKAEHVTYAKALSAVCSGSVSWESGKNARISNDLKYGLHAFLES
ncbi:MAG: phosphoribosylglycinamide formyltransferase [Hyphomicrobiales bacterium]